MTDPQQFLARAIATAQGNLDAWTHIPALSPREAARAALAEAHSALSQKDFFFALDALGGQAAAVERIVEALA